MRIITLVLFALLAIACTNSENESSTEVSASIGNDCAPNDAPEVWLRVADPEPADTNANASCPAYTDGGLRIRVMDDGYPLDSLKEQTYSALQGWDCRDTTSTTCFQFTATVTIQSIEDTEVRGTYQMTISTGQTAPVAFRAARCVLTPLCG